MSNLASFHENNRARNTGDNRSQQNTHLRCRERGCLAEGPIGLPITRPQITPRLTGATTDRAAPLPKATPAFASAKTGMMRYLFQGMSACSRRSIGDSLLVRTARLAVRWRAGIVIASNTPATVA